MRYVLGVLLFGAFVVFVTPAEMAVVVSMPDGSGDPGGLLTFGLVAAMIFGIPGYFAFPYHRRFQAIAWLALACMGYGLLIFGFLTFIKMFPQILSSPDGREFAQTVTIHYVRLALITVIQFAIWATLCRKKRA